MSGRGDGNFRWYWAEGVHDDVDYYYGGYATREEAIAAGERGGDVAGSFEVQADAIDDDVDGPGEVYFQVVEANRMPIDYAVITADRVLEELEGGNEEAWGEDGVGVALEPDEERELQRRIGAAIEAYLGEIGKKPVAFVFHTMRSREYRKRGQAPATQ